MSDPRAHGLVGDAINAATLIAVSSWRRTLYAWVFVPLGLLIILLATFGVNSLIKLSTVSFPASVACMITLFSGLILGEVALGDRRTKRFVNLVEIPGGFALRWINVFFCPSFVLLPLSSPISGAEVGKIIAIFLVGYVCITAATAYLVRGLQYLLGTSKRAMTERAEELGAQGENIPLTEPILQASGPSTAAPSRTGSIMNNLSPLSPPTPPTPPEELQIPLRAQDPSLITGTGGPPEAGAITAQHASTRRPLQHDPAPLTRAQRWAAFANGHLDVGTYGVLFLLVGLPIYFTTGYAMPAQLCLNILAYFGALALPANWKRFLHPVMVSSCFTILGIWLLAVCRRESLRDGLMAYQTKTKYTQLFQGDADTVPNPGAGDVFSSILEVSIVALALPMFQYRHELKRQFLPIVLPNIALALASLFGYPPICAAIGISPKRSLSFASRSLTLALATPATTNLSGDLSLVAVLCITSGMMGVLLGPTMLKYLRIPEDDYITRGVTLGANSSAIATALLLATDPRAAAFSSLSMSLFGTVTVAMTSVPPIVKVVTRLAGLSS